MAKRKRITSAVMILPDERILSLDISSVCVGFAVHEGGKLMHFGKHIQAGKHHGARLASFRAWLHEMYRKFEPHQVVLEAPYAGRKRFTFGVLMMYVAVVLQTHYEWRQEEMPDENRVQSSVVKRILRVKRGKTHEERKKLMVQLINTLYKLNLRFKADDKTKKVSDDDTADAIALGRAFLLRYRPGVINE